MSIDLNFLSKIVETKSLLHAYQLGIKEKHFPGVEVGIWKFIVAHHKEFKEIPSAEIVNERFGIQLPAVIDPIDYWAKEIITRKLHKDLTDLSYLVDRTLTESKPEDCFDSIREFVRSQLDQKAAGGQVVALGTMVDELITKYLDAESGKMGIPTLWSKMNDWTMGWWPGDVSWFSARLGVGKTFMLILVAIAARIHNYKVLFISGEMSRVDIGNRYAAIRSKLPYSGVRRGKLGVTLKEKYFEYLNECRQDTGLEIMDASVGFRSSDIELAIDKTQADIILIDAAYRIKANQKTRDRYDNMAIVADDLKQYAMRYKKPIVATTQLNREANKKKTFGDDDVALSDVIGWNATNMFALRQTDEERQQNVMGVYPLKVREGENARNPLLLNWNMDQEDFSEYVDTPSGNRAAKDDDGGW